MMLSKNLFIYKLKERKKLTNLSLFLYHIYLTLLPYYLPIAGGRIIGFISFPRALVLCEMQSVSSRIWTRVVVSISYDDNHYTTGLLFLYWFMN